ncbi:lipopolysaccharide biosynthesis protein [uncultured Streptomyces sp.]|uniref:lipopolysaccharide biosynthesis protein n=1 Tax=uncultured Streptomyces sp. TaxID=174707 RepID=UPI0026299109|nr:lipopolysaccharide biosynthesis protein [uncultured Streptomyces sp.]
MTDSPAQRTALFGRLTRRLRPSHRPPAWWPLPACVLLGAVCGLSYGLAATDTFESTGYAMAVAEKGTDPSAALGYAQSYGRLATGDATLGYAQGAAREPVETLRGHVRAETSPDSPMIAVTGVSSDPRRAAQIADAVVEALIVSGGHVAEDTGVKLIPFGHAVAPSAPVSPSVPLGTAVGASAGGLLGGLVLLVRPGRPARRHAAPVPGPSQGGAAFATEGRELVR